MNPDKVRCTIRQHRDTNYCPECEVAWNDGEPEPECGREDSLGAARAILFVLYAMMVGLLLPTIVYFIITRLPPTY